MMDGKGTLVLAALLGASVLAAGAYADHEVSAHFGTAVSGATARVVKIGADTMLVKARHLETLTIRNEKGQSFAWRFDTLHSPTGFPLKSIAPADFEAGDTWVYVGPEAHAD
ncbi:MAG: hypothetical protein EPO20_04290 [Betaproteobacteria bacterium]|nr:MAG: hypothetical protein EPO20_04290 [Betaproteobacteria bacterium]